MGYVSLVIVMLGYVVSPIGEFTQAEFSQKVFGVDFIVNSMLDFCPLLSKKCKKKKKKKKSTLKC